MRQQQQADQAARQRSDNSAVAHAAGPEDFLLDGHALPGLLELVGTAAIVGVFIDEVSRALQQHGSDQSQQEYCRIKHAIRGGDDTRQSHRHISSGEDAWTQRLIPGL